MKISEILLKYDTDKNRGSINPKTGHNYGEGYDDIFSQFDKESNLKILEVGIQNGGSLCAWKEYFKNSEIYGIDIIKTIKEEYFNKDFNYFFYDVRSLELYDKIKDLKFDIIIDDGSHEWHDVFYVIEKFLPLLNNNGILVIEDCQAPDNWVRSIKAMDLKYSFKTYDYRNKNGHYDDFLITFKNDNN